MAQEPSAAQQAIGDVAPKLVQLTDDVLFGDVWARPGLSQRDRSLITVATLVALYRSNESPFHLRKALENGVTRDELIEAITHLAFYAGWPNAMSAVRAAKDVFANAVQFRHDPVRRTAFAKPAHLRLARAFRPCLERGSRASCRPSVPITSLRPTCSSWKTRATSSRVSSRGTYRCCGTSADVRP